MDGEQFRTPFELFRDDPLVWRSFGFSFGVFVFGVTAALSAGANDRVFVVLPLTAVLAVLVAAFLIRLLQTRAFQSMQLARPSRIGISRSRFHQRCLPGGPLNPRGPARNWDSSAGSAP